MTVKDALVYLVGLFAILATIGVLNWGYRYVFQYEYWGVYALSQLLWSLLWVVVLVGLILVLKRGSPTAEDSS